MSEKKFGSHFRVRLARRSCYAYLAVAQVSNCHSTIIELACMSHVPQDLAFS